MCLFSLFLKYFLSYDRAMHETLRIIISTLAVIVITSLVFFALYFVAPSVSEDLFGISYRLSKENPVETFSSSFLEGQKKETLTENAEPVTMEAENDGEAILSEDAGELDEVLHEPGVVEVISRKIDNFPSLLESDGITESLNLAAEYISENGIDVSTVFSRSNLTAFLNGRESEEMRTILSFLVGGVN